MLENLNSEGDSVSFDEMIKDETFLHIYIFLCTYFYIYIPL